MRIHFIGAGGSGVSGLMLVARRYGHEVSGCDARRSDYTDMLEKQGCAVFIGHDTAHLDRAELLVHSAAVPPDHPELAAARACGIPIHTRGELLAALLKKRAVIGIAGAHGKTSTTWLAYHLLRSFGVAASVYAGGKCEGVTAVAAGEPWVVEIDESDGSIFLLRPRTFVLTNLELEHVDYYKTDREMLSRFREYLGLIGHRRFVIGRGYTLSDALFSEFGGLTFPTREELLAKKSVAGGSGSRFSLNGDRWQLAFHDVYSDLGSTEDPPHLIQNRAAALLGAYSHLRDIGRSPEPVDSLFWATVPPVGRRFEKRGMWRQIAYVDDYAHHPSELRALIDRATAVYGRFLLIFQPHRYSRFDRFFDDFVQILKDLPAVVILPVHAAGEPRGERDARDLRDALKRAATGCSAHYCDTLGEAAVFLASGTPGWARAIIAAGAGDVNELFGLLEE